MTRHLDIIVELQDALHELRSARERLAGIPDWMEELHAEHSAQKAEIEALEATVEEAATARREAEGTISDAQEQLQKYQQQINAVSTQREYGALLQEIDHVKEQIRSDEEAGLEALERQEEARRQAEEKRGSFAELDERYTRELAKWEAEKPGVAEQVQKLEARVEKLSEKVPRPHLIFFNRLLERRDGNALAPIRELETPSRGPKVWHCGACSFRVRPQVVVEIRNQGNLVQCDSCKRILYLEDDGGA